MKIGIISDTHDNLPKLKKAIDFFNKKKVGFVFHAGDFIAPFAVLKLKKLSGNWSGVFGNNDGEKKGLLRVSERRIKNPPLRMKLNGRKITLVHDINTINLKKEKADLIIFGHTHKALIKKEADKLIINPGECGGWLSGRSTIAVADLTSLTAKIFKT